MAEKNKQKHGLDTTIFPFFAGKEGRFQNNGYISVRRILSGRQRIRVEETEKTATVGDIVILQPYDRVYMQAETDGFVQSFAFDSPRYFDQIGLPPLFRFESFIGADEPITRLCEAIEEEYAHQSAFHETALQALTTALIIRLYRQYGEKSPSGDLRIDALSSKSIGKQKIVRDALAYIYENCQNGISSRDIASHVNVSLSYLCRCFSEICGETVLDFSDKIRCRKAHEDLTLGTLSVGEIAAKYHFSSVSYFHRRYRKFYGTNPAATLADAKRRHKWDG